jgi:hypothetical protein
VRPRGLAVSDINSQELWEFVEKSNRLMPGPDYARAIRVDAPPDVRYAASKRLKQRS